MSQKRKYQSFAFAKVNLTLRILSKLKHGYHRIQSFIIFLNLKDRIQLSESDLKYDKIIFKLSYYIILQRNVHAYLIKTLF